MIHFSLVSRSWLCQAGGTQNLHEVLWCEKLSPGYGVLDDSKEAIDPILVATQGRHDLLKLRGKWFKRGVLDDELVNGHQYFIALLLVASECLIKRLASREASINRPGQQFGIAEGVGDALGRNGVLVDASVPYQCPAGTIRLAEEVRQIGGAHKAMGQFSGMHALGQVWGDVIERLQVVRFEIGSEGAELPIRPLHEDRRVLIIGRKRNHRAGVACRTPGP